MTENEMIESLQEVWENMTIDKNREAYREMLCLLDNMAHFLRFDRFVAHDVDFVGYGG